jgi:Calcineurin-like phosphoesterase
MPTPTPVPPTSTPTNTSVPPTSTPTTTPVPPTATNTSLPRATPTSSVLSDPVVMAAGDIACDPGDRSYNGGKGTGTSCMQLATSNELTTAAAVLPLGDDQYNHGALSAFDTVYDATWGRYKANTYPASGNHEYDTSGAAGYYTYFGSAASPQDTNCTANCKGYYSYDLGAWHLIVLNSECDQVGGCNAGSPQEQWLKADLTAHATVCTLAYWHRPLFTSGISLGDSAMHDVWADLYNAHADLVLNGHDHIYERFAPQDPSGNADPTNGITEIIVGTGGANHDSFSSTAANNSVVRDNTTFGVLKLTLHPTSFAWQFLPETARGNGTFTDAGSRACRE